MKRLFLPALAFVLLGSSLCAEPLNPLPLPKADVLPLALDDTVQFRKTKIFLNDPTTWKSTAEDMIRFERLRVNYGAINSYERRLRYGHYYTFFWRAKRESSYTVRFEYRQDKLGSFVQAKELTYDGVKGSVITKFNVIGDDYLEDGRVTSWRALIIENGRIVALNQSYLWR